MITRTAKIGYNFERIGLTKEELDKVMQDMLEHNYNELQRIADFLKEKGYEGGTLGATMKALAEKQLTSSFTVLANAVDEKLFRLRNQKKKPFGKKEEENIKKQVEEGLKKKDTPEGKSKIEEAFEKVKEE